VRQLAEEKLQISNDIEHPHGYAECYILRVVGVHEGWEILGAKFTAKKQGKILWFSQGNYQKGGNPGPWLLNTRVDCAWGWIPLEQAKLMHR
jgi:hypothetical protein